MKWVREPVVEAHLRDLHIDFTVEVDIPIEQIDIEESLARQVRVGKKLNGDTALSYALQMEKPAAAWPMVILNRIKKHQWLWSGNHRIHGAQLAGFTTVDAYVVSVTDPRLQDFIPRIVNAWTGMRPTRDEFLANAQYMIENYRMEPKELAQHMGLRPEWIQAHMRSQQISRKVRECGVNVDGMSKTMLIKLGTLAENANVLKETAKVIRKYEVGFEESGRLIDDVKRCDTEKSRLQEVKKWEKTFTDRVEKTPAPFRTGTRSTFFRQLTSFHNFLAKITKASELQLAPEDIIKVVQYWSAASAKMNKLISEGKDGGVK
jgi:hypothetical protein